MPALREHGRAAEPRQGDWLTSRSAPEPCKRAHREAALLYDCVTASPAGVIRTAEFFRLDDDDRIAAIRLVFDAIELRKLMPPAA
jgi:hypothetical protein